ncbi:hypothetical protein K2173_008853 [Erythroxylum novogranatense]|uniref:DNA-(apurinic or apyrimidinic site) endonuclease n=1 Tax=Erythroxylum novogranatense TaxID=1862640 RepID=A0AAV8U991_9ROSI|nr:hypothetical protein K2173_008853 [Erythroxylum novogranatense]
MNAFQALHSTRYTFLKPCTASRVAVTQEKLRVSVLVSLRMRSMVSKRPLSSSEPPVVESNKDKKFKTNPDFNQVVVKETCWKTQSTEIQSFRDDPRKIDTLTCQELRTTLRNVGIPAKGRKSDLISALKCFIDKQLDGGSSQKAEAQGTFVPGEQVLLQKNIGNASIESFDFKIGTFEGSRNVQQSHFEDKPIKEDIDTITRRVGNGSQAQRRVSSNGDSLDAKAKDIVMEAEAEPWTVLAHKKPEKIWVPYNPRIMRRPPLARDKKFVKLLSWNVNGLRALQKSKGLFALELAQKENFDVLCLQETKLQEKDVNSIKCLIDGYENNFWTCSISRLGYSGTAIVSRIKPLSVRYGLGIPDHDNEGRIVTVEFESFYLLNAYVPNSGDGLKRLSYRITHWDPSLSSYMKELEKTKPVILSGDLNCAHQEIDIYNPAGNRRSAGFTDEERQSFGENFLSKGFVDTFRRQHPNVVGYTYWSYRHGLRKTNKGWRLDYFLASESIADYVHDSYILPDIHGSDHCPIGLVLEL